MSIHNSYIEAHACKQILTSYMSMKLKSSHISVSLFLVPPVGGTYELKRRSVSDMT